MISNKITELRKTRRITEKELAGKVGMSLTGFRQALEKDDFKASTLVLLASALNVNVASFFEDLETAKISNSFNHNTVSVGQLNDAMHKVELLEKELEGLKKELAAKDKIIKLLEKNQ